MRIVYAILAYAAKALKELHESQVIAGKGAGTLAAQTDLNKVTNSADCREAVGLSCHPRPQRRDESRRPRSYGQGNRRAP